MAGPKKGNSTTRAPTVEVLQEHMADLFARSGDRARLVLKYRHRDAKLSLRVTNDKKTATYKTRRQAELGKIKRLVGMAITGVEADALDGEGAESPTRAARKGKKGRAKKG